MPEGDTIWLHAKQLRTAFEGKQLTAADLRVPQHATADLAGRWMKTVRSRGKHLLMDLARDATATPDLILHTTLGMEGTWRIFEPRQRWKGGPAFQIRATISTADAVAVGYRLPHVDLLRSSDESTVVGHLGPDLLGEDWDPQAAKQRLLERPHVQIGDALLDQRNLAGVGNVYKSELCFLARVHPVTEVEQLTEANLDQLLSDAHRLLVANRDTWRRVTTGDPRKPMWVYSRGGQPCRICGTPIRSTTQGAPTRERFTWWCPKCQPTAMNAR